MAQKASAIPWLLRRLCHQRLALANHNSQGTYITWGYASFRVTAAKFARHVEGKVKAVLRHTLKPLPLYFGSDDA